MKHILQTAILLLLLGSSYKSCCAAQAAVKLKDRNGELRTQFTALKALPLDQQDPTAITRIKEISAQYKQEAQANTNRNTKRLVEELNAEIMKQWPEQKPSLWARFKSTLSYVKTKTDAAVKFVAHGSEDQRAKETAQINQNKTEIQHVLHNNDNVEHTTPRDAQTGLHITATEVSFHPHDTTLWGFTHKEQPAPNTTQTQIEKLNQQNRNRALNGAPATPAPRNINAADENSHAARHEEPRPQVASAHAAGQAQPEQPQQAQPARETTPLTLEEQKKQKEEIAAQAEQERLQKESQESSAAANHPSTATSSSMSIGVSATTPAFQTQERSTFHEKGLCDFLESYHQAAENPGQQRSFFRTKILPAIINNLQQRTESLKALAQCAEEAKSKNTQKDIEAIFTSNSVYQSEVNDVCTNWVYASGSSLKDSKEFVQAKLTAASTEALRLMCDYVHQVQQRTLRAEVAETREREPRAKRIAATTATTPAPRVAPAPEVAAPAAPEPAQPARTERSEALLNHLRALAENDSHEQRKALHKKIIAYLEKIPALLNDLTQCIHTNQDLAHDALQQALGQNDAYQFLEQDCLSRYAANPNLNAVRQEFIDAAINSQKNFVAHPPLARRKKANWWLRGIAAAAATYGTYGLCNLYAGTTKTMLGYKGMNWLGGFLPKAYSLTKAATFKVILPVVGIAAAGVICYACYRVYVHRQLSNAVAAAQVRCANGERTPQDREQLLKLTRKNLKESNKTMNAVITGGEAVEAVTGTNPVADAVQDELNKIV